MDKTCNRNVGNEKQYAKFKTGNLKTRSLTNYGWVLDWVVLALSNIQHRAVVNTVMNTQVP